MRDVGLRTFVLLFILFFLDMAVPLDFIFKIDFLMIGIIFITFYMDYTFVLFYVILFGMAKDAVSSNFLPFYTCNFIFTVLLIKILLRHFRDKTLFRLIIAIIAIIFNLILNIFVVRYISLLFSLSFILYSFCGFLLMDYALKQWIKE